MALDLSKSIYQEKIFKKETEKEIRRLTQEKEKKEDGFVHEFEGDSNENINEYREEYSKECNGEYCEESNPIVYMTKDCLKFKF
ncbi:hypothetical protein Glove_482g75 [Diversispora epigaea]|uniref:Uncharacterized protein n=1 Tax=Diversispora epigaea TaxID=1348612 RepID=A0A397GQ27_9GLOM|nr:hypothetical protein Glove_482g75 [Diversispora epigaea]